MSKISLLVCVVAIILHTTCAVTEEEKAAFRNGIQPIMAECSTAHGVTDDNIKSAKESGSANGVPPCFLGCVFKKAGVLNAKGIYDPETGFSKVKEFIKGEADLAKFDEVAKICTSVNDKTVGDGEDGCERAKLLVACILENNVEIPL